jgi:tetratricopeptide (TPR) repeat protein
LAQSLAEQGKFDEGIVESQEGLRLAEALNHPYSLAHVCIFGLGFLYSARGNLGDAARLLERAVGLSREYSLSIILPVAAGFLGSVYARAGRLVEGLALLQEALRLYEPLSSRFQHSLVVVQMGEACTLADQHEDALVYGEQALSLSRQRGQRGHEAWALRLLGEAASRHHSPDMAVAEAHFGAALALASELEMRPLVAHCHLGLGKLYRRTAKKQAHEHLATATTMYRDMKMQFYLQNAEAEMHHS